MAERSRSELGSASRGVVREIDAKLKALDSELETYEQLVAERERLRGARAALLGEGPAPRIRQEEIVSYLQEHPGSRAKEIADALEVPLARVSSHLYRGKHTVFVSRPDGWHLRAKPRS